MLPIIQNNWGKNIRLTVAWCVYCGHGDRQACRHQSLPAVFRLHQQPVLALFLDNSDLITIAQRQLALLVGLEVIGKPYLMTNSRITEKGRKFMLHASRGMNADCGKVAIYKQVGVIHFWVLDILGVKSVRSPC